jgi:C4-dicarboxylate-specific signal transduction histidine kinase
MLYTCIEHRNQVIDEMNASSLRLIQALSQHQKLIEGSTRQLPAVLAKMPQIQNLNIKEINDIFRDLLIQSPVYANSVLADPKGMVVASAIPMRLFSIANRKYYKDVLNTHDFSTREYVVGIIVKRPVYHFSYPVIDKNGQLKAIVVAALDLNKYKRIFPETKLPEGSSLSFSGHRGLRLYCHPDNDRFAGNPDLPVLIANIKPLYGLYWSGLRNRRKIKNSLVS